MNQNVIDLPEWLDEQLSRLTPEQMAEASEKTYILRAISELSSTNPQCRCGTPTIISEAGNSTHWRKLACSGCGKFFKWLGKPKNLTSRPKSTTGLPTGEFCVICLQEKPAVPLQAHHIIEVHDGGTNDPGNLQTVCLSCHEIIHWRRRQVEREL